MLQQFSYTKPTVAGSNTLKCIHSVKLATRRGCGKTHGHGRRRHKEVGRQRRNQIRIEKFKQ